MKGSTKMGNLIERGHSLFQTAEGMKANLKMVRNMAKEHSLFPMEENM